MTRAYPGEPTVPAGGVLRLHVASDAPRFRLRLESAVAPRAGPVLVSPWFEGAAAPARGPGEPWGWPAYALTVPAHWPPGPYAAHALEPHEDAQRTYPDARRRSALFVVRAAPQAPIVVVLPLFTYHAYNVADVDPRSGDEGCCLYSGPTAVTLHRPGGGIGGHLWDERHVDVYDRSSPRQTFAHWDRAGLRWLAAVRGGVEVCTDLDLHRGTGLERARLLVAFGHWEYWTSALRRYVETFVERGGNLAIFGGNTAWFRVRFDDARRAVVRNGKWSDDEPEESLLGTSYRFGGGRWGGERPPTGYAVVAPEHWVFAGTGARAGRTFGAAARLIGYECDGAAPGVESTLLARAPLRGWATDERGEVLGGGAAMLVRSFGRGVVFNAATADWARVLASGHAAVERITRNVVERLSAGG